MWSLRYCWQILACASLLLGPVIARRQTAAVRISRRVRSNRNVAVEFLALTWLYLLSSLGKNVKEQTKMLFQIDAAYFIKLSIKRTNVVC